MCEAVDQYTEIEANDIEQVPLDEAAVRRYQELTVLELRGTLSENERAELREAEHLLDEQENSLAEERAASLDRDIDRLKQLIALNRQVSTLI